MPQDHSGDRSRKTQSYYDEIKNKFKEERDLRLDFRPPGTAQYTSDFSGKLANYAVNPYLSEVPERNAIEEYVDVLLIGSGFSTMLTAVKLLEKGIDNFRIVDNAADFGGVWYWNRYPGIACDIVSYDYLPLLDEMDYVPKRRYSRGDEIFAYCQMIAEKYGLYDYALFNTTVNTTVWDEDDEIWKVETDRGDLLSAQFVICANGNCSQPKLSRIKGMEEFAGHSFHTSRWDYQYTGENLENLRDKKVGIIGTGASAVQIVPEVAKTAKELYVFQRTPSSIDVREDWHTDPNWARKLKPGWQAKRREQSLSSTERTTEEMARYAAMTPEEKVQEQENQNIDHMMRIHRAIDREVHDKATADALKPWYMYMCKRPCFHNEYLPTFNLPNVHLLDTHGKGITEINEAGPVFEDDQYDLDLLIYATGFEMLKTGIYNKIIGKGGRNLDDKYADGIRTALGVHTAGYPNLFIMGGQQASFQLNIIVIMQSQGEHIVDCIDYMRWHNLQAMDVTDETEEWWVKEVIKHRGKTSRAEDCTPGYYNFEGAQERRQDGNYNGSVLTYFAYQAEVREKVPDRFNLTKKKEYPVD